jgi:hypothetical protein
MLPTTVLTAILIFSASVLAAPAPEAAPALDANPAPALEAAPAALVARAGEYLGGVDLNDACRVQYNRPNAVAVRDGDGCSNWTCYSDIWRYRGIAIGDACARAYGNPTYAYCTKGAYDWGCYRA